MRQYFTIPELTPEQERQKAAKRRSWAADADREAGNAFHAQDYELAADLIDQAARLDPSRSGEWMTKARAVYRRAEADKDPLGVEAGLRAMLAAGGLAAEVHEPELAALDQAEPEDESELAF